MSDPATGAALADSSFSTYRWYLRAFARWMGPGAPLECITDDTRGEYVAYLRLKPEEGGRGYRPRTVRSINHAILFFYRWMVNHKNKYLPAMPAGVVKMPELDKAVRYVTMPDMALALIRACASVENPYKRALLTAIITMYNSIPLRKMELLHLYVSDVNLEAGLKYGEVHIRHGKGDKEGFNFLCDSAITALRAYLAVRPESSLPHLWLHHPTRYVGDSWLYKQIDMLCDIAGITEKAACKPHAYRRGVATRHRKAGVDIQIIQKMLRHASAATTEIYIEADDNELKEVRNVAQLFPAGPPFSAPPPAPQPAPVQPLPQPLPAVIAAPAQSDLLQRRRNNDWRNRNYDRR